MEGQFSLSSLLLKTDIDLPEGPNCAQSRGMKRDECKI